LRSRHRQPALCSLALASLCTIEKLEARSMLTGIVYPADSNVINVTLPPWNVVPNDGLDDAPALQAMLTANPSGNRIFYFPDGVYNFSATIRPAIDDFVTKRNIFQGQSRDGTILKLADNLDYQDAILDFRAGTADFFRNSVRDMTFDIGSGNPNATGLKFNASNQGTVFNVRIRSGDGTGRVGLDLRHSSAIGPNLIQRVQVDGFNVGIHSGYQTASQTFEDITLNNQLLYGWVNESSQQVSARRVVSNNSVPAVWNNPYLLPGDGQGRVLLIDSTLNGIGNASNIAAITNNRAMYVRNTTAPGYARILQTNLIANRGNGTIQGNSIDEYWANGMFPTTGERRGGAYRLFPESPETSLNLPIQDAPEAPWDPLSQWASPLQFGGIANDALDDTAAIQAAIDSGATTIYLPRGDWRIDGTVILRNNVRRFTGCEARLTTANTSTVGTIRLDDGASPFVVLERMEILSGRSMRYVHNSTRTWVFRNLSVFQYSPAATLANPGDVFIYDVVGSASTFRNQRVWARQLNIETNTENIAGSEGRIVNDGATLWILGFKTENAGTSIRTKNGGRTELLGHIHVAAHGTQPHYVTTNDSMFTAACAGAKTVSETRGTTTLTGTIPGTTDLYVAYTHAQMWSMRKQLIIDDADTATTNSRGTITFNGAWNSSTAIPGGFLGNDFHWATAAPGVSATINLDIPEKGVYEIYARWVNDFAGQDHAGHVADATYTISAADGNQTAVVDQRTLGNAWRSIGFYRLNAGANTITVAPGAGAGKLIVDSVRLVQRPAPLVNEFRFDVDVPQQTVVVRFDRDVGASLVASDFELLNTTTNTPVNAASIVLNYDAATFTARLTFPSLQYGALPDGRYTLTINRNNVTAAGVPMFASDQRTLSFLLGDANRDDRVNFADLLILAQNYDSAGRTFSQGNFDYDSAGAVSFGDLLILAARYDTSLPARLATTPARRSRRRSPASAAVV
jgi:hypothetical protein